MVHILASIADPSLIIYSAFFAGRFADLHDYLDAVREVWGSQVADSLRSVLAQAANEAQLKFVTLTPSADRRVENEVMTELLLHMPEPDFRMAVWKTAQGALKTEALAPFLNEVCRNRGIPWEFDPNEGFRWIGDHVVETLAVRPALSALEDQRFAGGVKSEFDSARAELALGTPAALKQAVYEAGSAVESAMKILLDSHGVAYADTDTAQPLFDHLVRAGIVPRFMERAVLSPATPRNRRAGHGAGAVAHEVPVEVAETVVAGAAVAIAYLHKLMP